MRDNYKYCAFFDVDGTILSMKTMFSFLEYYDKNNNLSHTEEVLYKKNRNHFEALVKDSKNSRELVNALYYRLFRGVEINYLSKLGSNWFTEVFNEKYINHASMEEINFHKGNGAAIVLVSGSMKSCLEPFARLIEVKHILCTKQEVVNGIINGEILHPQTIGDGKAIAIDDFCRSINNIDLNLCFAYGDHISDMPMLEKVGNPCIVKGDPLLEKIALKRGWKMI